MSWSDEYIEIAVQRNDPVRIDLYLKDKTFMFSLSLPLVSSSRLYRCIAIINLHGEIHKPVIINFKEMKTMDVLSDIHEKLFKAAISKLRDENYSKAEQVARNPERIVNFEYYLSNKK